MSISHFVGAALAVFACGVAQKSEAFTINTFARGAFNSNGPILNANVGIDDRYTIENFENAAIEPELSISYLRPDSSFGGGNDFNNNSPTAWDGNRSISIAGGSVNGFNGGVVFAFEGGASSVGFGLADIQSTGWTIAINGTRVVSNITGLANIATGSNRRSGYIRIDAQGDEVINTVTIDRTARGDRLDIDRLAFAPVPVPASIMMLLSAALGIGLLGRMRKA